MNGQYAGSAPKNEWPLNDRVAQSERGLELLAQYADALNDHYQHRLSQLEGLLYGGPMAPPFPSLREWAEQRDKVRASTLESPAERGPDRGRDHLGAALARG